MLVVVLLEPKKSSLYYFQVICPQNGLPVEKGLKHDIRVPSLRFASPQLNLITPAMTLVLSQCSSAAW